MAVPLMSARRPAAFDDVFRMGILEGDNPAIGVRSQGNSRRPVPAGEVLLLHFSASFGGR
jgi:hypothetical protein